MLMFSKYWSQTIDPTVFIPTVRPIAAEAASSEPHRSTSWCFKLEEKTWDHLSRSNSTSGNHDPRENLLAGRLIFVQIFRSGLRSCAASMAKKKIYHVSITREGPDTLSASLSWLFDVEDMCSCHVNISYELFCDIRLCKSSPRCKI